MIQIQTLRYLAILFILILSSSALRAKELLVTHKNIEIEIKLSDETNITNSEISSIKNFIQTTLTLLPKSIGQAVNRRVIEIEFTNLNDKNINFETDYCSKDTEDLIFSNFRSNRFGAFIRQKERVQMDNSFINAIINSPHLECSHQNARTIARGHLIRKFAKIFDRTNTKLGIDKDYEAHCRQFSDEELDRFERNCKNYLARTRSISSSPYYRNLSGWITRGIFIRRSTNLNHFEERSPNPLEFESVEDSFAVNLEYFLLDPNYQCMRPTLAKYFEETFNHQPFSKTECEVNREVTIINQSSSSNPVIQENLSPDRLYQVQYLFASKGERMSSRWGHSLFKLVFCAPHREEVGPDCLYDRAYHIVLSFRANVEDIQVNYLDGLRGEYDSIMLIQPLIDVIDEYNKGEFRDLISLPINMTAKERKRFLDKALEIYWSYKGQYYFISNNCATEALNLMKMAMPNNFDLQYANIVSPRALYRRFQRSGIFDGSVIEDLDEARDKGYYFPAFNISLERSYSVIRENQSTLENVELQKFLADTSAEERKDIYDAILKKKDKTEHSQLISNFIRIEDHFQRVVQTRLQASAFAVLTNESSLDLSEEDKKQMWEYVNRFQELQKNLTPESQVQSGYGIPLKENTGQLDGDQTQELLEEMKELYQGLNDFLQRVIPNMHRELEATSQNRVWLIEQLMGATGLL